MGAGERNSRSAGEGGGSRWHWAVWLLLVLGFSVGAAEFLIMLWLVPEGGRSALRWALIDAGVLLAVAFPAIYLLSYRPLAAHLDLLTAARDRALESEERLAEAQRLARLGNWELEVDGGSLLWSEEMFLLFDRSPAGGPPTLAELLAAVHEEDRGLLRAAFARACGGAPHEEVDYRIVLADGSVRHLHEEARAVPGPGGSVLRLVGTTQDVTERTLAQQALLQDDELMRTLVALHEGGDRLALEELTTFAVEEMVRSTGSALGYLFFYEERSERFTTAAWSRAVEEACRAGERSMAGELAAAGLWGEAVRQRRAVITNDYGAAGPGKRGLPGGHPGLARHMAVPIFVEGRIVALAGVGNKRSPYGAEDERQVALFGRGLWEIVERKRREQEVLAHQRSLRWLVKRLAVAEEEERRRIAGELHDTIVQDLAAARLRVAALREGETGERRTALEEVTGTLDRAIGYSRALTYELSSPLLHQFGIEAALPWLVEQTGRRHGLQARCDCGEEPLGLSPEQGALLYRIAQELLRNVVKHAAARRVTARLVPGADAVRLEVGDDGRGFRDAGPRSGATESGGFGLFSIRERLRDVGGTLRVETAPGRGTRVVVTVPRSGAAEHVCI